MPEEPIEADGPYEEPTYGLPKPNDSLFNHGKDFRENFQLNFHTQEHDYIHSFKVAADGVIQAAVDNTGDPSWRFMSACFLYRHYLELTLKNLIRRDCWLRGEGFSPTDWQSHSLPKLWNEVAGVVGRVADDQYLPLIKVVERIVNDFHEIDPTGQELRYHKKITHKGKHKRKGEREEPPVITPSLEKVRGEQVGILNLRDVMQRLNNFFLWVDHCIDLLQEAQAEEARDSGY